MEKRNRNNGESWAGEHGLNGGLKGRKGGEIKTGGREIKVHGGDGGWVGRGCR